PNQSTLTRVQGGAALAAAGRFAAFGQEQMAVGAQGRFSPGRGGSFANWRSFRPAPSSGGDLRRGSDLGDLPRLLGGEHGPQGNGVLATGRPSDLRSIGAGAIDRAVLVGLEGVDAATVRATERLSGELAGSEGVNAAVGTEGGQAVDGVGLHGEAGGAGGS